MRRGKIVGLIVGLLLAAVGCHGKEPEFEGFEFSPDGTALFAAYFHNGSSFIYRIPLSTGKAVRFTSALAGFEGLPSFSADGRRIAYSSSPGGQDAHSRIVIANADGSDPHPTVNSGTNDFRPLLSPDNKTVIFKRYGYYGNYSPIARPAQHEWNFYETDLEGNHVRPLTNESFYMVSPASLSPDGKTLLFVDSFESIVLYSVAEPSKPKVVLKPRLNGKKAEAYSEAVFAADGKSILFTAAFNKWGKYNYNVYRLNLNTQNVEALTTQKGHAGQIQVSRDGEKAVFLYYEDYDRHGKASIFLLDLKTLQRAPLIISGLD